MVFSRISIREVATTVFLVGTAVALWLGIGATFPID